MSAPKSDGLILAQNGALGYNQVFAPKKWTFEPKNAKCCSNQECCCICVDTVYIISGRGRKNGAHICIILGRGRKTTGAPPCLAPLININMYTYIPYNHSLTGVTSFLFGDVRFLTLDQWVSEYRNFEKLRTIPFFHRFKKTKSFQTWKRVVKRQKFISASQKL